MTIKQQGGVFGRHPTFSSAEIDDQLTVGGNLLVGKDAPSTTTVGHDLRPDGVAYHTRDGDVPLVSNRNTSDGAVFQARKDNIVVGELHSRAGAISTMVLDPRTPSATVGAGVGTTLAKIVPADSSGLTDAKNDLGGPSNRWKDFYLSGNVIVANGQGIDFSATAGTGTSELFDDYEEGTWTPTIEGSTTAGTQTYNAQVAKYTKVGRTVTIYAYVSITNKDAAMAGNVRIGGLPYASDGTANALQALALGDFQGVTFGVGKTQMLLRIPNNVTKINVYDGGSGLASAQIPVSNINNATYFVVGGTYQTA